MATATKTPSLRSLYRQLLRELPPTPQPRHTLPRTPIHKSIRAHVAAATAQSQSNASTSSSSSSSSETPTSRIQEMHQYVLYLRAQRMYTTLLQRYNPGMGMDEEERVRLSARRVGMNLPVEYEWNMKR